MTSLTLLQTSQCLVLIAELILHTLPRAKRHSTFLCEERKVCVFIVLVMSPVINKGRVTFWVTPV